MSTALIPETVNPPASLADLFGNLTFKQKSFADLYIEHRNGCLAAKLAGYDGDDNTLRSIASENLTKPNILAYIKAQLEERHLTPERILAELGDVAAYSLDSIAAQGSPVKTQDKLKACELIGKYHRLFGERAESDLDIDVSALANLLRAVCERARAMQQESAHGGPASSSQPIIDVTPIDHAPLLPPTSTATSD